MDKMLRICVEIHEPDKNGTAIAAMVHQSNSKLHFKKLAAAFFSAKIWNAHETIRIGFLQKDPPPNYERHSWKEMQRRAVFTGARLDPIQKDIEHMSIPEAVRHIVLNRYQPIVGMRLEFVDDPSTAQIRITLDASGGAWSLIGTDCKHASGATMNLGWFDAPTVLHEFGHAFGLVHEHQNPRGNPIQWNEEKLYAWASRTQHWNTSTTYSNIVKKYSANQVNGSIFDPESIMLYFFPATLTIDHRGTKQNMRLSPHDVWYLSQVYPGGTLEPKHAFTKYYGEPFLLSDDVQAITTNSDAGTTSLSQVKVTKDFRIPAVLIVAVCIAGFTIYSLMQNSPKDDPRFR